MAETPKTLEEAYNAMLSQSDEASASGSPPGEEANTSEVQEVQPEVQPEANPEPQSTQPSGADPYMMMSQQTEALKNATGMISRTQSENQQLRQEIERMRTAMDEQNNAAEVSELRQATTPPAPPQIPNFDELAYLSDEEKQNRQNEYANQMAEYIKTQALADIQPYLDKAKEAEVRDAEEAILAKFSNPQNGYADFAEFVPMIRNIAKNNPLVAGAEISDDKFLTAYAIAKGIKANEPQPAKLKLTDEDKRLLSNDELLDIYRNNPDLQKLIAQEQIQKVKETGEVPVFSAGGDAGNVALSPSEKPKTMKDARQAMINFFKR